MGVFVRVCFWVDARGSACVTSYVLCICYVCIQACIRCMQKTELRTAFK